MIPERRKISAGQLFVVLLTAAEALALGGCASKERNDVVVVEKVAQIISHHHLSEAPIGLQIQSKPSEGAITTWFFHCSNHLDYKVSAESFDKGIDSASVVVTGANARIGLTVDVFVKEDAPAYLKEHEEGHAKICQLIYRDADKIAYTAAHAIIGKTFHGVGASHKQAMEDALTKASEAICSVYRRQTAEVASIRSKKYDEITKHGHASISVDDAIARAAEQDKED